MTHASMIDRAREAGLALSAATERLNAVLQLAQGGLIAASLGVAASVPLDPETELVFCKDGSTWGLFVVRTATSHHTPLLRASRRDRVHAAAALDQLLAQLLTTLAEESALVAQAIDASEAFLSKIATVAAPAAEVGTSP